MKNKILILAVLVILYGINSSAQAQRHHNRCHALQHRNIMVGISNEQINYREAKILNNQQARVFRTERLAKLDGRITPKERIRLHEMHHRANRSIIRARHNSI